MNPTVEVKVIDNPAPAFAQHAFAMGVVDHNQDAMLLSYVDNRRQRRNIAIHTKDAIGDDQAAAMRRNTGQPAATSRDTSHAAAKAASSAAASGRPADLTASSTG